MGNGIEGLVSTLEAIYLGSKECWIDRNLPREGEGTNLRIRDVDLVVRSYNTLYAKGADELNFPAYPVRLARAAKAFHDDWNSQVGIIGLQEASDVVRGCIPSHDRVLSVTSCFAKHLANQYQRTLQSCSLNELGVVWDDAIWQIVPGPGWPVLGWGGWKIGRRPINFWRDLFGWGGDAYLQGVRLRHRERGWILSFFNTHLAPSRRGYPPQHEKNRDRVEARSKQIDKLLSIIDPLIDEGELPPVLVGDFNFTPDERVNYDRLNRRFALANEEGLGCLPNGYPAAIDIDHIWVGRREHFSQTTGTLRALRYHVSDGNDQGLELHNRQISDHASPAMSFKIIAEGWQRLPGSATDIGIGAGGQVWVIGTDPVAGGFGVHRWTGNGWQRIDGGAINVAVGQNGEPWIVDDQGVIYRRLQDRWQRLPGSATDIGIGAGGQVWVIGTDPVAGGFGVHRWTGNGWQGIDGGGVRVAVGSDGRPWVVNDQGNVYRRQLLGGQLLGGWQRLPGSATDIGIGAGGQVWVIGTDPVAGGFGVHRWTGNGWQGIDGGGVRVAVGSDGRPWVVDDQGAIYRRT